MKDLIAATIMKFATAPEVVQKIIAMPGAFFRIGCGVIDFRLLAGIDAIDDFLERHASADDSGSRQLLREIRVPFHQAALPIEQSEALLEMGRTHACSSLL